MTLHFQKASLNRFYHRVKILLYLLIILISSSISSQELEHCLETLENLKSGELSDICEQILFDEAKGNQKRNDDYEKGAVSIIDGALFFKDEKTYSFIGNQAAIRAPIAVVSDSRKEEIAYLNKDGDIFIFSSRYFGNISPARKVSNKANFNATDLCLSEDFLFILNTSDYKIIKFDRMANSLAISNKKKDEIIEEYRLPKHTFKSMGCSSNGETIFLLDTDQKVHTFELRSGLFQKLPKKHHGDSLSYPKKSR